VETVAVLVEGVKPSWALAWVSQKYQHRIVLDWWEDVGGLHKPLASMSAHYLLFRHRDFHGTTSPLWALGVVKCVFSKYEQFSKLDKKLMLLFARAMPVHYLVDITVEAVCNGDRRCLDAIKPVLLLDWYVRDAEILTHACTELCRRSGGCGTEAQLGAVSVLFDAHAGWLLDVKEVKQVAVVLVQRKQWSMMRRTWIEACTAAYWRFVKKYRNRVCKFALFRNARNEFRMFLITFNGLEKKLSQSNTSMAALRVTQTHDTHCLIWPMHVALSERGFVAIAEVDRIPYVLNITATPPARNQSALAAKLGN
jgi:hypothetical protein